MWISFLVGTGGVWRGKATQTEVFVLSFGQRDETSDPSLGCHVGF